MRVRDIPSNGPYVGRAGVVQHTDETYVYVQGAQFMGDDPAAFHPWEVERV